MFSTANIKACSWTESTTHSQCARLMVASLYMGITVLVMQYLPPLVLGLTQFPYFVFMQEVFPNRTPCAYLVSMFKVHAWPLISCYNLIFMNVFSVLCTNSDVCDPNVWNLLSVLCNMPRIRLAEHVAHMGRREMHMHRILVGEPQ
jgi:hypothetical protein